MLRARFDQCRRSTALYASELGNASNPAAVHRQPHRQDQSGSSNATPGGIAELVDAPGAAEGFDQAGCADVEAIYGVPGNSFGPGPGPTAARATASYRLTAVRQLPAFAGPIETSGIGLGCH
jgi:hypothetical protein